MSKVEVSINPGILDWVLSQLSNGLAPQDAVGTLTAWREGRKTPTFHKVAELSRKIHIPFGYFFMETPPEDKNPLAEYRTVGSSPIPQASRDLLDYRGPYVKDQKEGKESLGRDSRNEALFIHVARGYPSR